jgi:hypothetical protein
MAEREKGHATNYRGCRHAKKEVQKKNTQRIPETTIERKFSSNLTTPGLSFAAALQGNTA